ncbi:hypothetical protein [Piscinibacter terrae]|uniref:Uncharacterized protein n=1 Tax=Piscinibacter terrae TaxID=2496871 RepID=A0A3N7K5B2_9BURK|nr:hypothetical protein [Albitalea terrae]RQP26095.1 hypothetical protein DZC73_03365 [Albitalea terrae]
MKCVVAISFATLFSQCSTGNTCDTTFEENFSQGVSGWVTGLSDYTDANKPTDAAWAFDTLPSPGSGSAYHLSLTNRSQDAMIWTKKLFTGLEPGVTYSFEVDVGVFTNASTGCADSSGATGADTHLMMLADTTEPSTTQLSDGTWRLNSDTLSGTTLTRTITDLGSISVGSGDCAHLTYAAKQVSGSLQHDVVAPSDGNVWVLMGVDAKYSGKIDVFFQTMKVSAKAQS